MLKFTNGKNRGNESLRQAINYILNPEKTSTELISGNGIDTATPCRDMETIQFLFGQKTGRRYIHYVISFDRGVSEKTALLVAEEASCYFAQEYQYIMAVHTNTDNVHVHVILNAVNVSTGKKFSQSRAEMLQFRDFVNGCLAKYDLNLIGGSPESQFYCEAEILEDWEEEDGTEDYNYSNSFFGAIDPDEITQIQCAELEEENLQRIIQYFQGESEELPPDIYYEDAEIKYWQWCDSQRFFEEDL